MPIYEYKCVNGHVFETVQSMAADPVTECEVCGAAVERVYHPVAVHFKGSGFYSTDYGSKRKGGSDGGEPESAKSGKESDDSQAKPEKKEPAKAKSESSSSSSSDD